MLKKGNLILKMKVKLLPEARSQNFKENELASGSIIFDRTSSTTIFQVLSSFSLLLIGQKMIEINFKGAAQLSFQKLNLNPLLGLWHLH